MEKIIFLSNSEVEQLSVEERKEYYQKLKLYCQNETKTKKASDIGHKIITTVYPLLRKYTLEIRGEENIPKDDSAIFMCNHSNSHDFFTAHETFAKIGKSVSVFAARDGLNPFVKEIFSLADATLIDRTDKESSSKGVYEFSKKIIEGKCGVIFGESTWNLHPLYPMQTLKIGGTKVGAITGKVIVPTIFEYIEVPEILDKEADLYSKCIISFGEPIKIKPEENLITQTAYIQHIMSEMRKKIWEEFYIKKDTLSDINPELYINHTYLKKFKAFGYTYDSEYETQFLYSKKPNKPENEYHINEDGEFVPGIIKK